MNENYREFRKEVLERVAKNAADERLTKAANEFMVASTGPKYCYNFEWMGRPIIQYPQDIVAMQELLWKVKPDLVVETGIAHGGSLVFTASMLALLDVTECSISSNSMSARERSRKVIGIDIDIRAHNREAIDQHPLSFMIEMIEGSSIDTGIVEKVSRIASGYERILVCLDSNHTHEHVLAELNAYSPLVTKNSYCVVFDTVIEELPYDTYPDREWSVGNNPRTAVWEFIKMHPEFEIDSEIHERLMITVARDGFLRRLPK